MSENLKILVAAGAVADGKLLQDMLRDEFGAVKCSTDPALAITDFESLRPSVLILAFKTLEEAERYYLGLFRGSSIIQTLPHRAIVLCFQAQTRRAYELCRLGHFDDYVPFWPTSHDPARLPMTIRQASRRFSDSTTTGPSTVEMAVLVRRIAELEALLQSSMDQAGGHIEAADREISRQLPDGARLMQPVRQWISDFKTAVSPHMDSVRALEALAEEIRPLVLVVDDDEFQCKLIGRLLEQLGLDASSAGSAMEAFSILRERRPDLILMDVEMPDIDGIEVTRQVKSAKALAGIPIVMITGNSEKTTVQKSLNAGASDFLVKPVDKEALRRKIDRHLGRDPRSG